MKRKGFTLIELLVVITIIGLLTVITVPSIILVNKRIKQKESSTTVKMIKSAAKIYGRDKKGSLFSICEETDKCCAKVTLADLINQGYFEVSNSEAEFKKSLGITNYNDFCLLILYKNRSIGVEDLKCSEFNSSKYTNGTYCKKVN